MWLRQIQGINPMHLLYIYMRRMRCHRFYEPLIAGVSKIQPMELYYPAHSAACHNEAHTARGTCTRQALDPKLVQIRPTDQPQVPAPAWMSLAAHALDWPRVVCGMPCTPPNAASCVGPRQVHAACDIHGWNQKCDQSRAHAACATNTGPTLQVGSSTGGGGGACVRQSDWPHALHLAPSLIPLS